MWDLIVAPLDYHFMRNGLIAAVLVGITCAALGAYVVYRRMAFIGDALAHTALPGLVVAYLNGWSLFLGALVADLLAALGIGWLSRRPDIREDTAIGILFTGTFGLGVLLMSGTRSFRDFTHMLFGDILGIGDGGLLGIAVVAVVVLGALALLHKELELASYDPGYAAVIGIRTGALRLLLLVLLALAVVTGIQLVGVVLTSALLVTPAAAASLLCRSLGGVIGVATVVAVLSGVVGLYASYYQNISSGAAIVVCATVCFAIAYAWSAWRRRPVAADQSRRPSQSSSSAASR